MFIISIIKGIKGLVLLGEQCNIRAHLSWSSILELGLLKLPLPLLQQAIIDTKVATYGSIVIRLVKVQCITTYGSIVIRLVKSLMYN